MSISTWFSNWLASRKAEQRTAAPDHSVRLFVRRLEDRQVLSVSSILVGTDVTFTGDDGGVSADSIIFCVDIDGNLEHNLGGTNGFHSNIDLDNSVAGDQILAVDDITQLSIDLGADSDSVDFADHFDFASGSLSVTAESISATLGSLSVSGLAQFDAGSANSISLLGSNDFHQVQIVSADNVFLNDINALEFAGASAVTGDLEVTFGSLVTDQLTNAAGASLWVGDMASFSGGSISLGEAVGDTLHFGRLHLDAVGAVVVEEDSATELTGDVFASELRLVSAGDITDTTGAIQITGLASFSGSSISLGGALTNTNFGSLNFSSTGAVAVQEDSATELAGANSALSLQIVSAGDLTDTSASLMVSDLAQFEGTSITLGGATRSTELGMLTFSSLGDVSIQVDAATQLAGDNAALSLVLNSTGAISDSSSSLNVTNHAELSGSSIAIGGAGISTNFGSLSFHSLGAVTVQEDSSTQVSAASTAGSLDLQSVGQVQLDATVNVTNGASITADGAISVSAAMSSGGTASLTSQNGVTVDAVIEGATVSIEAADGIVVNARIEAVDAIELTAGTDGSGSVQTALAGDLFASNAGGTATIQIASGVVSGGVLLARATTADGLVRITSASEINGLALITASEIELFAATGIGTLATLQLSGATITAQSTHGNIDLSNTVAATYAQVSTGTGTIAVFNTGAAVFADVTTTDGAIHLVAVDGDLNVGTNVSAGGADADDNVTLLNANGNIVLTGTTTAIGNQVLAITDGSIGGAGQVSTADVDLQAGTGINANLAAENIRVTTTSGGVQLSNTAISPQTTLDLTTGGDAEVHNTGALSLVGTVDGDLTVTVTAGDLTDSGPLSVSGTSSLLAAGDVILDHTSNDFGGAVAVSGQAVELIDANSLTLGQIDAVTVQVTASGSITLGTGAGEDLEATDCVQLQADSGGVVQQAGSTILTDRLALTGTGPFTLELANDVNVLAVNIDGSIHFADSNALIVGTACGVSGLATSGQDARLSTGGNLTIGEAGDLGVNDVSLGTGDLTLDVTGAITQLSGNTISATGLQLLGGGGSVQLSESNTVATLAADRDGTIEFTNSDALTVGTVTDTAGTLAVSTSGVTTSGDDVRLIVLGDLLIDEAISLGAGALSLNVTGTISQNVGDTITAAGLSLSGNGAGAELGGANDIDTFASDYQGTVLLSDIDDLTVGSVTAVGATTTGISNTLDTKLTTGGDLHLAEAVDLRAGTLLLDVDGAVTQSATGTIQATGLALLVTGTTSLDQSNDVDILAADTQGSVLLSDIDDLTIGSVTCGPTTVAGIATTFDVKLVTGGDLQLAEAVDLGLGNLLLEVDGAITQSASGSITAASLALMVDGTTALDQANDVDTLAANSDDTVLFRDLDDLAIGSVTVAGLTISGISTASDTRLVTGGDLTLTEAVNVGPGHLLLDVDGAITQSDRGTIQATGLALLVTGTTTLDQNNDVDLLAADTQGSVEFNDIDALTVSSVTAIGMTVRGVISTSDVKLVIGNDLQFDEAVDLGSGNLSLDVDGAVSQSATGVIQAAGLALSVMGTTTLDQANDVDTLAAQTQGSVRVSDVDDLTVGSVTSLGMSITGLSTTFDAHLVTGGNLHLAEAVNLGSGNLLLDVDGAVTQSATGTITAAGLALMVIGTTTLDQANDVDTFAADTQGSVLFNDVDDLTVGSVTSFGMTVVGISTTFDTKLVTGGNLTLTEAVNVGPGSLLLDVDGAITQTASGTIQAGGLALLVTGNTTLDQANDVDRVAADAQGLFVLKDVDDLTVGSVTCGSTSVVGISTTLDTKLITGSDLHVAERIDLGPGNLLLDVDGAVTQSATGTITAAGLALMVTGSTTLNQANDVDTFAADTQGSVFLNDIDNLTVGSVTSLGMTVTGIRSTFDARLVNGGDLHFDQAVDLGPGNLLLDVDGAVTQSATGTITAAGLALMVTGRTTLDQANDVDALAADTQGTLLLNDVNDLTVGSVTSLGMTVTGIRSTSDAKLTTGRDLQLAEAVDLGAGNLFLDADGDVTQSVIGTITAAGLALMVSGGTTLDQANDVDTLAAQTQGSVEFHDVDDLQIGIVSENASPANMSITGATVDDADFTVSVGAGNLTLEQAIDTGAGDIRLEATTGSILDGQDGLTQITAHNLSLTAQTQIGDIVDFADGTGDAIDVSLTGQLIQASVTDAGGEIFLNFHGDLSAASGAVNVGGSNAASAILRATGGDIDVGTAIGVFSLSSGDNLALEAIEIAGAGGTLVLPDAGLDVGVGDLRLRGDVDVRDAADRNLGPLVADDLHFTSGAGSGDTTLTTRINTLTAQITGSGAGLTVLEADGLVLTDIDLVDGDLAVHASQSTAGDIEVIDVAVGDARITLDTTAHGGGQIVDADTLDDPNRADLTATEIDLRAGSGIAHGAKLEIAAERLAAMTVSGQINIRDVAGDLTIAALARGTAGVSVTAGVAGDDICISTVGAMTVNADVSSSGMGDREILLAADGDTAAHDLTVNADLSTTGGNSSITLLAGDSILFAGTTITSAAGTGAVQARAGRVFQNGGVESAGSASGDILMSDGSIIQSDNGTITLSAPNDIQLSVINANAAGVDGEIVLTADADGSGTGQIREVLSGESSNLIADHVTFTAAGGIGTADDIDTTVISIEAANTTSGSIIIHEIDALAITGTGVQTQAGNGNVQVTVDAGTLTVDSAVTAHGSGDVTLTATSGAAELNAEISSTSGDIQIAGDSVTQSSDITTGGTGTIQVVADTGSVTMADGTQTSTELGSIEYSAAGDIAISQIRSDSGPLSFTADSDNSLDGAIIDNTAGESANLATGGTLTLLAATGIGSGDDLNTDVGLLIATNTTSGDIAIREADGLIVTGSGVRTRGGNGNVSLVVDDGTLVVNSLIAAHGSGNVTLEATQGPAELNATVSSTSGNLTITADAVNQNSGGDLETGSSGAIDVTADAGAITMADGTAATTTAGNILYSATGDVRLSHLSSRSGDLTVRAGAGPSAVGAIIDNTVDELPNLQTTGSATLIAETGIGASDDIDTAVSRLDLTNSTRGAIQITEVDAVQIAQLSQSGGGHVFVQTTNGSITVDNANVTPQAIRVSGGGSLVLDANGAGANVIVNDAIQSIGGDITLLADRNIETHSAAVATTGGDGDLTLVAGRDIRILDPGNLNPIDLQATESGTVSLRAANELVLGSQNPRDPNATQHTTLNDVVVASQSGQITNTLPILFDVRSPQVTAEGEAVLSVTIGRPGETNLAVRVYWGDGTVETFTGLVAGTYTYRHFYTANPNPLDPAAPILVNVQVAHDPKILLVAPNVNSSVLSVLNGAIAIPPPVPTPNINADLAKAIYNPGDPLFPTLQGQIVSSPGSEAAPGTVVFQDTTFLATTIPVPGEGLATFVFDTTPPVKLLDFPEGIKIVDTLPPSTVQVSEGTAAQLVAEGADDAASGERQVILEVISPTGEVIQQAVLPESTLDDLQTIIGRLPDGQYRFQLKEAGEDRLRLLLEFEVRQGKIADETDATDRPPSNKKPAATEPMEPDAEKEAPDQNEARLLLPELPDDDDSVHSPVTPKPPHAVSMAARRAWKQAAEITSPDHTLDETDPADATASHDPDTRAAALGVMVAVVGAGLAVPERSRSQRVPGPQLGRVSRLLRRVRSTASGLLTENRQLNANEMAAPMVVPLGEWTSC